MADKPGSFRGTRVSSRTVVVRKAKEEDARRHGDDPNSLVRPSERERRPGVSETSIHERPAGSAEQGESRQSQRRVAGNTVVVQRGDGKSSRRVVVSSRMSGHMASVRVTGGDTIVRYKSGELVVKRSNRRAQLRWRIIWGYAICYLAVFVLYLYYIMTGTAAVSPAEYLSRSFAKRQGEGVLELERAAMEVMRGNRTPAEVRMAQELVFHDENNDTIRVEVGDRLTLLTAAKLGQAIIRDEKREESKREFNKPFRVYRETYLTNMKWPFWLSLMNAFGFFLLLALFLWRPGRNYLGTQGKKTAVALREARLALEHSEEIRDGYRRMSADLEKRGETMRESILEEAKEAKETTLAEARDKAKSIVGEVGDVLDREEADARADIGTETAGEACRRAAAILEKRLGRSDHDRAIEELIAGIEALRPA